LLDRRLLWREPWWGVLGLRLRLGLVLCWDVCTEVTTLRLESLRWSLVLSLVLSLVKRRARGRRASKKVSSDSKGRRACLTRGLRPLQRLLLLRHLLGMLLGVTLGLRLNGLLLVVEGTRLVVLRRLEGRSLLLLQRTWRRAVPIASRRRALSGAEEWDGSIFDGRLLVCHDMR
jgi:hypothetical protein